MRNVLLAILAMCFGAPSAPVAELFTNPATNIGKKNLYVGAEYSTVSSVYELDTKSELPVSSERALLRVTAGLTDWLDIYVKGGGVGLLLNYKDLDDNVILNYNPQKMKPGFGAGTRIRLLNFVNSGTQVFFQGGGFFFNSEGDIKWEYATQDKILTRSREMRWLDLTAGIGVSKRIDFVDLNFGVGFSEIKWWIKDDIKETVKTTTSTVHAPWRDSFETKNPVMGFIGLDFILPHEYRLSIQGGVRNMDAAEFTIAVSQGLERD
ncbi:MAG: hypothetical protein ACYC9O_13385 [Candidatus Latescibacterota bacterium]